MEPRDSHGLTGSSACTNVVADSVATYSDDPDAFADFSATAVASLFAKFASLLAPGAIVLDAGCGPGRDLARLAGLGHKGIGVDLNEHFAERALIYAPTIRGDLRRLPLASDSFDAVWACASLIHLPVDDAGAALGELARVARPGAPLCVSVKVAGRTGWADDSPQGRRWFCIWTPGAFTRAVERAGFLVEEVTGDEAWVTVWARALSPESTTSAHTRFADDQAQAPAWKIGQRSRC